MLPLIFRHLARPDEMRFDGSALPPLAASKKKRPLIFTKIKIKCATQEIISGWDCSSVSEVWTVVWRRSFWWVLVLGLLQKERVKLIVASASFHAFSVSFCFFDLKPSSDSDSPLPKMSSPASVRWIHSFHMHDRTSDTLLLLHYHGSVPRYSPFSRICLPLPCLVPEKNFKENELRNMRFTSLDDTFDLNTSLTQLNHALH